MADRTVTTRLRLTVTDFVAGGSTAKRTLKDLNGQFTETAGFAAGFRKKLEAAFKSLPKIEIDADSSPAEVKITELRQRLETLSRAEIGVDFDGAQAMAEMEAIQRELEAIDGNDVAFEVRAGVAQALTELRAIDVEISRVDGRTADVNVNADVGSALASIALVGAALASLPVLTTLTVGVTALGSSLAAAGIGAGAFAAVAVPSFGRVSEALKASETAAAGAGGAMGGAGKSAAQAAGEVLQLEQAEKRLKDAQAEEKQAQEDLTRAREDGRRSLEDMNFSLDRSVLSQKDAALAVREAYERMNEVNADADSSQLERERAALSYEQAQQRVEEQEVKTARAIKDTAVANKAGVAGTKEYQDGLEDVATAQDKVAQAEAQLKQLHLQQAAAMSSGGGAAGGLKDAFADLSKQEKILVEDLKAFKDEYVAWQKALQPDVLPAISQGLKVMSAGLVLIGPSASGAGKAFTALGKEAESALRGPWWASFFADVNTEIPGAITSLGHIGGNVFQGFAGLIQALLPYGRDLLGNIEDLSGGFAKWGTGLGADSNFRQFMAEVQMNGPQIWETLKDIAETGGNLVSALAPFGIGALGGLSLLAKLTADMSPEHIQGIALAVAAVYGAVKTGQAISAGVEALGALRGAFDTTGTAAGTAKTKFGAVASSLVAGGPWGIAIGAGIAALGLFAASHFEAQQRVAGLTEAIKSDSGALGENTRAKVANTLQTSGAMETARKYGIGMKELTDAAMGNEAALARVNAQLANQGSQSLGAHTAIRSLADGSKVLTGDTLGLWNQLNSTNSEIGKARQNAADYAAAMGTTSGKTGELSLAQGGLAGKTAEAAAAFAKQLPQLMELAGSNEKAKAEVLKLAEAYGISAADAEKAAKGGRDLRDVLAELKSKEITITVKTEYQDELSRDALREASKRANGGVYGASGRQYMALGGIRDVAGPVLMASGGVRNLGPNPGAMVATSPHLISGRAGPDVVFAEAGAESYIPLAQSKRLRGMEVLATTANIMGQQLVPMDSKSSAPFAGSSGGTNWSRMSRPMPGFSSGGSSTLPDAASGSSSPPPASASGQPGVTINMPGAVFHEQADVQKFGARVGFEYGLRGKVS